MAEKDYTKNAALVAPTDGVHKSFLMKNQLDFKTTPLLNADSAKVFPIKAGWEVKNVHAKIVTPEDAAVAFTIGIAAGGTQFEGDGAAGAVAGTRTRGVGGTDAGVTAGGQKFTADGFLFFDAAADLDTAVIDVTAEVVNIDA